MEYYVDGEKIKVVHIPIGNTHNIENLGDIDLVTIMWASECYDSSKPDHVILHTGQNWDYGLNQIFFEDLEPRAPDYGCSRSPPWTNHGEHNGQVL